VAINRVIAAAVPHHHPSLEAAEGGSRLKQS
jgi:hypothetical protein